MLPKRLMAACVSSLLVGCTLAATSFRPSTTPVVRREIVAIYLGAEGADARSGMTTAVRDMQLALARSARADGREFVSHGVSLEPLVADGLRHLARLGSFDEVSVGGNWANSSVVKYLGGTTSDSLKRLIPQVVLVEREVRTENGTLEIGPERELGRHIGAAAISAWVRQGAPLTR